VLAGADLPAPRAGHCSDGCIIRAIACVLNYQYASGDIVDSGPRIAYRSTLSTVADTI
jgi:hypothetical protein